MINHTRSDGSILQKYSVKPDHLYIKQDLQNMFDASKEIITTALKKHNIEPIGKFRNFYLYDSNTAEKIKNSLNSPKPLIKNIAKPSDPLAKLIKNFLTRPMPSNIRWKFY